MQHSWDTLLEQAKAAAAKAYSPYSGYQVGCALVTAAGNVFQGCNVENASYGLTICAERNAIFAAVAAEGASLKVSQLAVVALGHEFPPCGACRQVIAEFADAGAAVAFLHQGQLKVVTMADLLPAEFTLDMGSGGI
jgi:cytidine deaminase